MTGRGLWDWVDDERFKTLRRFKTRQTCSPHAHPSRQEAVGGSSGRGSRDGTAAVQRDRGRTSGFDTGGQGGSRRWGPPGGPCVPREEDEKMPWRGERRRRPRVWGSLLPARTRGDVQASGKQLRGSAGRLDSGPRSPCLGNKLPRCVNSTSEEIVTKPFSQPCA